MLRVCALSVRRKVMNLICHFLIFYILYDGQGAQQLPCPLFPSCIVRRKVCNLPIVDYVRSTACIVYVSASKFKSDNRVGVDLEAYEIVRAARCSLYDIDAIDDFVAQGLCVTVCCSA